MGDTLLQSPAPPPALFAWGQTRCLTSPMVAIVGTRGATTYGKAAAQKFAEAFVRAGLTVVSGGAVGIDLHAHEGALQAGN
ncbi:MAG: DNA-processing protein DprA, partial [Armatimonadetes bacterium]|nr:DNA-processing protein DprA [Armatimonadota bacterium]